MTNLKKKLIMQMGSVYFFFFLSFKFRIFGYFLEAIRKLQLPIRRRRGSHAKHLGRWHAATQLMAGQISHHSLMCRRGLPWSSALTHFEPELSERIIDIFFFFGLHQQKVEVATVAMDKPFWAQGKLEDACEQPHEIQQNSGGKKMRLC